MKKLFVSVIAISLISVAPASAASVAAGQKCTKVNQATTVKGVKLVCTKSGNKMSWTAQPAASKPVTQSAPAVDATLTGLWAKYNWKYKSKNDIIKYSTNEFTSYIATKRSPNQEVKVLAQDGADATLVKWVKDGATLVATTFAYPAMKGPFYDVIAVDSDWLKKTYLSVGVGQDEVNGKASAFDAGAPAFGGTTNNTWNWTSIKNNNLMKNDKAGMAQTAGHEFFHAIQENYAHTNPGGEGLQIPNWIWEGPATFIGLQTAAKIGAINYESEGRAAFIERYKNGDSINRTSNLIEIKANDGKTDPYALGFAATELAVANIGIEKFNNIYAELGKGKNFADAFKSATGVELADFYAMFEDVRAELGFAKS